MHRGMDFTLKLGRDFLGNSAGTYFNVAVYAQALAHDCQWAISAITGPVNGSESQRRSGWDSGWLQEL